MGDLTNNLSRSEFACRCGCGFDTVDIELPRIIQGAVNHFKQKLFTLIMVRITGPNRCVDHNRNEGGAASSQHIYARAGDIQLFIRQTGEQINPDLVAKYLEDTYPDRLGIGRYSSRTHVDNRTNGPVRWSNK